MATVSTRDKSKEILDLLSIVLENTSSVRFEIFAGSIDISLEIIDGVAQLTSVHIYDDEQSNGKEADNTS